jgi:hypothetical protein
MPAAESVPHLLDRLRDLWPDAIPREERGADGFPGRRGERCRAQSCHPRQDAPLLQQPPERHASPTTLRQTKHERQTYQPLDRLNNLIDRRNRPSPPGESDRAKPRRFARNSIERGQESRPIPVDGRRSGEGR